MLENVQGDDKVNEHDLLLQTFENPDKTIDHHKSPYNRNHS